MQETPDSERRQYVRAPLRVDVEFTLVDRGKYKAVRRSERGAVSRVTAGRKALVFDQVGQYEADSAFNSNLIEFLIHMDDKLDTVLKLLSRVSGIESRDREGDKGNDGPFPGRGLEISGAGMSAICDRVFEPGQILRASFMISRFPVIPLVIFGEVMRVKSVRADGKDRCKVAVKFLDLDEEDREKIIAYTFQMQRDAIRREKRSNNG